MTTPLYHDPDQEAFCDMGKEVADGRKRGLSLDGSSNDVSSRKHLYIEEDCFEDEDDKSEYENVSVSRYNYLALRVPTTCCLHEHGVDNEVSSFGYRQLEH